LSVKVSGENLCRAGRWPEVAVRVGMRSGRDHRRPQRRFANLLRLHLGGHGVVLLLPVFLSIPIVGLTANLRAERCARRARDERTCFIRAYCRSLPPQSMWPYRAAFGSLAGEQGEDVDGRSPLKHRRSARGGRTGAPALS
jgi:hypothetical protein